VVVVVDVGTEAFVETEMGQLVRGQVSHVSIGQEEDVEVLTQEGILRVLAVTEAEFAAVEVDV